jgi:hypothetical protein
MAYTFESVNLASTWGSRDNYGFRVEWVQENGYLGNLTVYVDEMGLRYDSESMSDEFCIAVLAELIKRGKEKGE